MRSNVREARAKGKTYTVILSGEDISNRCIAFDSDEGWADCYILDDNGNIALREVAPKDGWKEFDTVTERLHGTVIFHENEKDDEQSRKVHSAWVREFFRVKREENE